MNKGRSLELYFVDGKPDGMLTAEVFDWTGHVLRIPKIRLPDGLKRPEAKRTGVYILLGQDDTGTLAYIGEAENISDRLRQHASQKDWWDEAVLVTAAGDGLHKAHVKYLESRLVEMAKDAGVMRLENANIPPKASLNEAATANMESFLDTLHMVLPAIRVDLFQSAFRTVTSVEPAPPVKDIFFEISNPKRDLYAKILLRDNEFIVLAGARMRPAYDVAKSMSRVPGLRAMLEQKGLIKKEPHFDVLLENYAFSSPSGASDLVLGTSTSGPKELRHIETKMSFREWEQSRFNPPKEK